MEENKPLSPMEILAGIRKSGEDLNDSATKIGELSNKTYDMLKVTVEGLKQMSIGSKKFEGSSEEVIAQLSRMPKELRETVQSIPAQLSEEDVAALKNVSLFRNALKWSFAASGLALLIMAVSLFGAVYFYNSSVKAKSELREEIVREISEENKKNGQILVNGQEHRILQNEYDFLKIWVKANPRDSRALREKREAYFNTTRKANDANFSSNMK